MNMAIIVVAKNKKEIEHQSKPFCQYNGGNKWDWFEIGGVFHGKLFNESQLDYCDGNNLKYGYRLGGNRFFGIIKNGKWFDRDDEPDRDKFNAKYAEIINSIDDNRRCYLVNFHA